MAIDASALCSLAQVKSLANIPTVTTTNDAKIEYLINAVSKEIELDLDRTFSETTHTEYHSGDSANAGARKLFLRNWPIDSITSIHNSDNEPPSFDATSLEDSTYYRYDDEEMSGVVYFGSSVLCAGFKNIQVIYVAGYDRGTAPGATDDELPYDLQQAVARHVVRMWKDEATQKAGRTSKAPPGGGSVEYLAARYEKDVFAVLIKYMRWD